MSDAFALTPQLTAQIARPAQATQYTIGDIIADSQTAASVVPLTFTMPRPNGRIYGARFTVTPASGNMVITAAAFDLLIFRGTNDIPFAATGYPKDNDPFTLTQAMYNDLIAVISPVATGWRNALGGLTAGAVGWQAVPIAGSRSLAPFNTTDANGTLRGVLLAADVWNPGNVVQTIAITLDADAD